jgi:hypothetical protein
MTAAVVNHLRFDESVDPDLFVGIDHDVLPHVEAIEGLRSDDIVRVTDHHIASNAS